MRWWLLLPFTILLVAVQSTLLAPLAIWGIRPDLILVFIATVGMVSGPLAAGSVGLVTGFCIDAITGRFVGLGAISKAVAGVVAGALGQRVFKENALVKIASIFLTAVVDGVVYFLGAQAFGFRFDLQQSLFKVLLPGAWYTAAAALLLYPLFTRVWGLAGSQATPGEAAGNRGG